VPPSREALKSAAFKWLRGDDDAIPPHLPEEWLKEFIAAEWELAEKTPQERRVIRGKRRREDTATVLRLQIHFSKKRSKEAAIAELAASKGMTVEALKQALKPSSISGESRRKHSPRHRR
jgi:hypothetical protein